MARYLSDYNPLSCRVCDCSAIIFHRACELFWLRLGLSLVGHVQPFVWRFLPSRWQKTPDNKDNVPCCRRRESRERKSYILSLARPRTIRTAGTYRIRVFVQLIVL